MYYNIRAVNAMQASIMEWQGCTLDKIFSALYSSQYCSSLSVLIHICIVTAAGRPAIRNLEK